MVSGRGREQPDIRGMQRGPKRPLGSKASCAFQRDPRPAEPGPCQPVKDSQVSPIFLMSFSCSARKWFSRKSEPRACPGPADPKGPGSGSSPRPGQLPGRPEFHSTPFGRLLHTRKRVRPPCRFCIFKRLSALPALGRSGPRRPAKPHCPGRSRRRER